MANEKGAPLKYGEQTKHIGLRIPLSVYTALQNELEKAQEKGPHFIRNLSELMVHKLCQSIKKK